MSYYIYYWKELDQETVMMVCELQICEEVQTRSVNQSSTRTETEVAVSSFEVQ